jgi:tRNA threonylcarbamoyl adenosine modification protein (Sua5/YciO/YrdC/YwlC family)
VNAGGDQREIISALQAGRVVAIPTDTVYGLAVDPRLPGATDELFRVKGRPEAIALPVLIGEAAEAPALGLLDERAAALVDHYWPGPLTIVVKRQPGVVIELGGDPSTIGLRCPAHAGVRRLLAASGPLAVTSANRHGEAPCVSGAAVRRVFGASVAVLAGGPGRGHPSTVVSLVGAGMQCLRAGSVPMSEIEALVGW